MLLTDYLSMFEVVEFQKTVTLLVCWFRALSELPIELSCVKMYSWLMDCLKSRQKLVLNAFDHCQIDLWKSNTFVFLIDVQKIQNYRGQSLLIFKYFSYFILIPFSYSIVLGCPTNFKNRIFILHAVAICFTYRTWNILCHFKFFLQGVNFTTTNFLVNAVGSPMLGKYMCNPAPTR